jgi:HK97 family phage major capsid protein/HK97 family phage prohead protease
MKRCYSFLQIKSFDEDQRVIEGIATSPEPDRVGDIVEPLGVTFKNPAPLLWMHMHDKPVGTVNFGKPTKAGVPFKAQIAKIVEPGTLKNRVDEAWQSVKSELVRAVSIGFRALEDGVEFLESGGIRFTKTEILELSLVTVPANSEAVIENIKSIDRQALAASGHKAKPVVKLAPPPGASGKPLKPINTEGKNMSKYLQQIKDFENTRAAKVAKMAEIMDAAADAGVTLDDAQTQEYDTLDAEVKQIDAHLTRLNALEKAALATATKPEGANSAAASASRAGTVPAEAVKATKKLEKGITFARYAMCLGAAKGDLHTALSIAENRFGDSQDIVGTLKAAVAAGTTTDATWASPLVQYNQFAGDFVEFLRPQTIIGRFGQNGIPSLRMIPFNVHIRGQTSGGEGYWVGEGKPKPLTKFDFNDVYLGWAKVANIAVLTQELMRFSDPSAERLVRDSLAEALIARLDIDFIDPAKAISANVSPASITNGVTPVVSQGNTAADIRCDIQALMAPLITARINPQSLVWIMTASRALALSLMRNSLGQKEFPDITMSGGTFEGIPVIVSEYVPTDSNGDLVILANASDIWLADDGQVVIDASREASLQMDNAPTNASAPVAATSVVSMFQTNSVALRAERFINWKKRRAQAVQYLDNVNWGVCDS